ncbi:hypothetical protein HPB50_012096 [Hyalomma asiaticum]|uniref:Uncharacterized protein n=1 Tax=Hyalomma asiaticum TaxID=266040 RepID=A0ACB7SEI8_HYAAI|nr:hypothetical protein HPB50_012096 [Hyalomma asiaticum]
MRKRRLLDCSSDPFAFLDETASWDAAFLSPIILLFLPPEDSGVRSKDDRRVKLPDFGGTAIARRDGRRSSPPPPPAHLLLRRLPLRWRHRDPLPQPASLWVDPDPDLYPPPRAPDCCIVSSRRAGKGHRRASLVAQKKATAAATTFDPPDPALHVFSGRTCSRPPVDTTRCDGSSTAAALSPFEIVPRARSSFACSAKERESYLGLGIPQKFREQSIDGTSLPLLTEDHLTVYMGMRLGPALKLRTTLAKMTGRCTVCMHCIHCHGEENDRRSTFSASPASSSTPAATAPATAAAGAAPSSGGSTAAPPPAPGTPVAASTPPAPPSATPPRASPAPAHSPASSK